jgi:hypothetical protein
MFVGANVGAKITLKSINTIKTIYYEVKVADRQAAPTPSKLVGIRSYNSTKYIRYLIILPFLVATNLYQCNILWRVG